METAEDFDSQTLPTLDFQCWVERGRILYKFFSKPMAKQTLIMKNSALGENSKIASLTQEVVRRSKNTSEEVSMEARVQILDEFHRRLELSQYNLEASRRIMVAGLRGYERIRDKAVKDHNQSQLTLCYVSACTVIKLAKLHTAIGSGFSAEPIAELRARF